MMEPQFNPEQIGELCRRHRIKRLAMFGSAARGEMRPDSDVDLLVEFEPRVRIDLGFVADDFSKVTGGHPIDLAAPPHSTHVSVIASSPKPSHSVAKDNLVYIGHIRDTAEKRLSADPREDYNSDENLRLALAYLVQIICEAARGIDEEFRANHPAIPWKHRDAHHHRSQLLGR